MTGRTRLVTLSHVSFQNGQLQPIRAISEVTQGHGALLLVDGAQSLGAIEVDVGELGCDAYAASGQKWMLGPEGTGVLYTTAERLTSLQPIAASYGTAAQYDADGYLPHSDGRRLEFGTSNPLNFVGQLAALGFLGESVGMARAARRATALATETISALSEVHGVTVLTPRTQHATLVSLVIDGVEAEQAVSQLADRSIFVRSIAEQGAIRLSIAFFTTKAEIAATVDAIGDLAIAARRA
jgi:L-cysteine/cystine lyase